MDSDLEELLDFEKQVKIEKPHLRFSVGDTVFLKTDTKKETPMVINSFAHFSSCHRGDYFCIWFNTAKTREQEYFRDEVLTL